MDVSKDPIRENKMINKEEMDESKYNVEILLGYKGVTYWMIKQMKINRIFTLADIKDEDILRGIKGFGIRRVDTIIFSVQELMIDEGFVENNS